MKNPVAKHLNTFNKPLVVPQKQRKLRSDATLRDAREAALNELVDSETMCLDCVGCSSIEIDCEEE